MPAFAGGIKAYPELHGLTKTEHTLEKDMGIKQNVEGFDEKRNQIPYRALGDKPYKYTEDSSGFYREGGLIPGSSQPHKLDKKGTGSAKIVDYYANLDLTKPVPGKGLKWKDKLRMEALAEDKKAVNDLIKWFALGLLIAAIIGRRRCSRRPIRSTTIRTKTTTTTRSRRKARTEI